MSLNLPQVVPNADDNSEEKVASYYYYSQYDPTQHFEYEIAFKEDGRTKDMEQTSLNKSEAFEQALEYHWGFCQPFPYEFSNLLKFYALPNEAVEYITQQPFPNFRLITKDGENQVNSRDFSDNEVWAVNQPDAGYYQGKPAFVDKFLCGTTRDYQFIPYTGSGSKTLTIDGVTYDRVGYSGDNTSRVNAPRMHALKENKDFYEASQSRDIIYTKSGTVEKHQIYVPKADNSGIYELKDLIELKPVFLDEDTFNAWRTGAIVKKEDGNPNSPQEMFEGLDYDQFAYATWKNQQVYRNAFMIKITKPTQENLLSSYEWASGIQKINDIFEFNLPIDEGYFRYDSIQGIWEPLEATFDVCVHDTQEYASQGVRSARYVIDKKYQGKSYSNGVYYGNIQPKYFESDEQAPELVNLYYTPYEDASKATVYLSKEDAEARYNYLRSRNFPNNIVNFYFSNEKTLLSYKNPAEMAGMEEMVYQAYIPARPTHKEVRLIYDKADYMRLYRPKNRIKWYTVSKKDFNTGISTLNSFWTMSIPDKPGDYKFHKKTGQWLRTTDLENYETWYRKKYGADIPVLVEWIDPDNKPHISTKKTMWETIWEWIVGTAGKIWDWIKGIFGSVAKFFEKIFGYIGNWVKDGVDTIKGWFGDINSDNIESKHGTFFGELKTRLEQNTSWGKRLTEISTINAQEDYNCLVQFENFLKNLLGQNFQIVSSKFMYNMIEVKNGLASKIDSVSTFIESRFFADDYEDYKALQEQLAYKIQGTTWYKDSQEAASYSQQKLIEEYFKPNPIQ